MWKTNLIIALRVLGRNKTISLINIIGLSVAFAVAVLCLLFVRHETSFDTWHEKGDRIFAIYLDPLEPEPGAPFNRSTMRGYRLREDVLAKVTGIRESVAMRLGVGKVSYGDATFDESFLAVGPAFLTMFTLRWLRAMRRRLSTILRALFLPMRRHRSTSAPMYQPTPCWASASGCTPSSETIRHRR